VPVRWRVLLVTGAMAVTAVLAGCSGGHGGPVLIIKNFAFSPQPLTVKAGQPVTVRNFDPSLHGFATDDGSVMLGAVNPGGARVAVFPKAGRYTYHCTLHASMKGALVVR
jgi:plastocyanin